MVPAGLIGRCMAALCLWMKYYVQLIKKYLAISKMRSLTFLLNPCLSILIYRKLDASKPDNYSFTFEVGMKPDFQVADLSKESVKRYKIDITELCWMKKLKKLRTKYGNMTEPETVTIDENVLNVTFIETDAEGNEVEGGIRKIIHFY
jgi:trigger factor